MNEIYLSKKLIKEQKFTNEMFMCYVAIRKKQLKDKPLMYINIMSIIYELTGKLKLTRAFEDKIKTGIEQLVEHNYIKVIQKEGKTKTSYVIDTIELYIDYQITKEPYSIVTEDEVFKIMNYDKSKLNKASFLRYGITVLDSIYTTTKYGCHTTSKLIEPSGISENTAYQEYNKYLENMQILYIHRPNFASRDANGTIKKASNTYGRYTDKHTVIKASEEYHGKNYDHTKNITGDEKRTTTALYRSYAKGTYKGSINALVQMVERYNNDTKNKTAHKFLDISIVNNEYVAPVIESTKTKLDNLTKKRKENAKTSLLESEDADDIFGTDYVNPSNHYKSNDYETTAYDEQTYEDEIDDPFA